MHKAVSECESAFHSAHGKRAQHRSAEVKEAKKLPNWCQELAKEISQLPSDGSDEVAYYISGFEAYDFEMETFVSRGGSTVQSNGVEFGGAFLTSLPSILKTW